MSSHGFSVPRICSRCSKVIGSDQPYYSINNAIRGSDTVYFHGDESICDSYTLPAQTPATDEVPGYFYTLETGDEVLHHPSPSDMPRHILAEDMQPDVRSECPDAAKPLGKYAALTTPNNVIPIDHYRNRGA